MWFSGLMALCSELGQGEEQSKTVVQAALATLQPAGPPTAQRPSAGLRKAKPEYERDGQLPPAIVNRRQMLPDPRCLTAAEPEGSCHI